MRSLTSMRVLASVWSSPMGAGIDGVRACEAGGIIPADRSIAIAIAREKNPIPRFMGEAPSDLAGEAMVVGRMPFV